MGWLQITVLMATKDREAVLPRVLGGCRRLEAAPFAGKFGIVDNGGSDATLRILRSYSSHLPLQLLRARAIEAWKLGSEGSGSRRVSDLGSSRLSPWVRRRLAMLVAKPGGRIERKVAYQVERRFREQWIRQKRQLPEVSDGRELALTEVDQWGPRRQGPRSSKARHGSCAGETRRALLQCPF
jgi:hypothetical protein